MTFKWKVTGKKMESPVVIESDGETALQALFRAGKKASEMKLEWDEIEYI